MTKYKRKLYVHIILYNIYVSKFYMDSNMPSTPKDVKLKLLNDHLHIFPRDIGTYPGSCWNRDTVSQGLYDPPDSVIAKVHEDANQVERHQGILQIVPCWSGNSWVSYRHLWNSLPTSRGYLQKNSFRKAVHTLDPTWMSQNRVSLN